MSYLAPILQDVDTMFQQLRRNLNEILTPDMSSDHLEDVIIEIDVTAVVKNFARFAATNMVNPLLKQSDRGNSEVDRQAALAPIGMSFVLGFVLAGSYRNELENLLSVSLEHPSDVIEFTDMSRMARARGDQLIEKLLGTALSNLSVLDNQTVEIGLVMEEAANACELGLRLVWYSVRLIPP